MSNNATGLNLNFNQDRNVFVRNAVDQVWDTAVSSFGGTPYYAPAQKDTVQLRKDDFNKVNLPNKYTNEEYAKILEHYNGKEVQSKFQVLQYQYKKHRDHFTYGTIFEPPKSPHALDFHAYRADVIYRALTRISASDLMTENSDYRLSEGENFRILVQSRRRALAKTNNVPEFLKQDPWIMQEIKFAVGKINAKYPNWKGKDEDGNLVPVTEANVEQMLAQPNILKLLVPQLKHQANLAAYYAKNDPYSQLSSSEKHDHILNKVSGGLAGSIHDNKIKSYIGTVAAIEGVRLFGSKREVISEGFKHRRRLAISNAYVKQYNKLGARLSDLDKVIKNGSAVQKTKAWKQYQSAYKAWDGMDNVMKSLQQADKVEDIADGIKLVKQGAKTRNITRSTIQSAKYARKGLKVGKLAKVGLTAARWGSNVKNGVSAFLASTSMATLGLSLAGFAAFELAWGVGEFFMTDNPTGFVAKGIKGIVDWFKGDDGSGEAQQVQETSRGLTDNKAPEEVDLSEEIRELQEQILEDEAQRRSQENNRSDEQDPYLLRDKKNEEPEL